ncbi:hypothetical protein F4802DRAFT_587015 [Xylaria palmicola]|nr:hypothetical protein F4802DRAFT_587015 [Xylaria palmicola]
MTACGHCFIVQQGRPRRLSRQGVTRVSRPNSRAHSWQWENSAPVQHILLLLLVLFALYSLSYWVSDAYLLTPHCLMSRKGFESGDWGLLMYVWMCGSSNVWNDKKFDI